MIEMRALRRVLLVLPMLVLAACNTVGDGNKIVSLKLVDASFGADLAPSLTTFQCMRNNIALIATFTNGQVGNYTDRATWTSDNPSVARVSNSDITLPSDATLAYFKGTIIPVAPGITTITANYVGLKASVQVVVQTPNSITLFPLNKRTVQSTTIAPKTVQSFSAIADLAGRLTDITSAATWSFASPNDAIATFAGGSSFVGIATDNAGAASSPLTVQANLNSISGVTSCPFTPTTQLSVADIAIDPATNKGIRLSSEFGNAPSPLIIGTTDLIKAEVTLKDGSNNPPKQDISNLVPTGDGTTGVATTFNIPTLPSSNGATISIVLGYVSLRNLISAISTGTTADTNSADLTAKFVTMPAVLGSDGISVVTPETSIASDTLTRSTQAGTLQSISITPALSTINAPVSSQYPEDGARQQFRAIGTFLLSDGTTQLTQDVTRHVTWTTSDATIAGITNASVDPINAGLAGSLKTGTVTITATSISDATKTATATLVVQ